MPSKSSGASTSVSPTALIRKLTSRKQSKALAVSSASIALSISSAFSNTHGTSNDCAIQERVTGWQTAYAAAKMAVEIAKESSDVFPPLKAVLGALSSLLQNYDQATDNDEAVKDIERRVHLLSGVIASPVNEDDYAEKARRVELQRKLKGVIAKLEPLSEQHTLFKFVRNVDDAKTLAAFVQELADAVTDYQVSIQQGMYGRTGNILDVTKIISGDTKNILGDTKTIQDDTKNILQVSELELLDKLAPVRDAGYQGGHHDKCLPGTRESVLQDIMFWAKTPQEQNVFWLNGLAGTGKSTIAQSISEIFASDGSLGASFFCSRDFLDRRVLKNIFPTLAYQFACRYSHVRNPIIKTIKKDPTIAHTSLISQLENLLVVPLSETGISCVVVIDALDECIDDQPASAILSVLGRFIKSLPLVKFFITGRPEPRIRTGFRLPLLQPLTQIFLLHEVKLAHVSKDIRLYLTQRLTSIAKRRSDVDLPNPWPRENEIIALTKKSSGLFIFASTIVRFIESEHHEPDERLQLVLSKTDGTMHEGGAGLDFLYTKVLLHAFSDVREDEAFDNIKRVLGAIILAFNPLSRKEISTILGVPMSLISMTLRHLHSVVLVPADETEKIRVFHKSFPDFLQDRNRCTDLKFRINPTAYHSTMALSCLELVKKLKVNPCGLPPFTMNQDVHDLPQMLENKLGGAVRYACCYWARHLKLSWLPDSRPTINSITKILKGATPWIEVMSLENRLGEVIHSMYSLLDWLDEMLDKDELLYSLATDYLRLTMYFFRPIQQCAQQIYHTALHLSPVSSQLHSIYQRRIAHDRISLVDSFIGAPYHWGLLLTTIDVRPRQLTCIATFGQKIVAACEDIVNIYDAVTFILEQSLRAPQWVTKIQEFGDGSILYLTHSFAVTSWDTQTGGLIATFTTQSEIIDMVVSPTGDHVACGLSDGSVPFWNTRTMKEGVFGDSQPLVAIRWLSPAKLVVATQDSVYVSDVVTGKTSDSFYTQLLVWGTVVLSDDAILVGTSGFGQGASSLKTIKYQLGRLVQHRTTVKVKEESESSDEEIQDQYQTQNPYAMQKDRYATKTKVPKQWPESTHPGRLILPTLVGNKIVCMTPPRGVEALDRDDGWIKRPSVLDAATSVATSLNRNLVAQTGDSVQVFPIEVLTSGDTQNYVHHIYIYPLGEDYVICLQQNGCLTILDLKTLQPIRPAFPEPPPMWPLRLSSEHSFESVEEIEMPMIVPPRQSWYTGRSDTAEESEVITPPRELWYRRSDTAESEVLTPPGQSWYRRSDTAESEVITPPRQSYFRTSRRSETVEELEAQVTTLPRQLFVPLPRWTETAEEGAVLGALSPNCTRIAIVYDLPQRGLLVRDMASGTVLAKAPLRDNSEAEVVYHLTFGSETRIYLRVDGPRCHAQIPYDIIAWPSGQYPYTIKRGDPVPLSEPRNMPLYALDANYEWVLDAESRKVCWISPENIRRGNGGHFWAGLSLVMLGSDDIVRKLTLRDPRNDV